MVSMADIVQMAKHIEMTVDVAYRQYPVAENLFKSFTEEEINKYAYDTRISVKGESRRLHDVIEKKKYTLLSSNDNQTISSFLDEMIKELESPQTLVQFLDYVPKALCEECNNPITTRKRNRKGWCYDCSSAWRADRELKRLRVNNGSATSHFPQSISRRQNIVLY
jgi:hypothetical protein